MPLPMEKKRKFLFVSLTVRSGTSPGRSSRRGHEVRYFIGDEEDGRDVGRMLEGNSFVYPTRSDSEHKRLVLERILVAEETRGGVLPHPRAFLPHPAVHGFPTPGVHSIRPMAGRAPWTGTPPSVGA